MSPQDRELVQALASVPVFAMGLVGFAGHISKSEETYQALLRSPQALQGFLSIANAPDSTIEAKIYAACALRQISRSDFGKLRKQLSEARAEVSVFRADILRKERAKDLLARIAAYGCTPSASQ